MPSEAHLYKEAGMLYCKVAAGVCNLKNGLFQSNFTTDLKKLLAIVAEAIKNKAIVNEIFNRANSSKTKPAKNGNLECADGTGCDSCKTKVQIYDMLFGKATSNTSGCPLISKMRFYKNILDEIMKENKLSSKDEVVEHFRPKEKGISLPVYVRINLLLTSKADAIEHFQNKGYNFLNYEDKSVKYNQFLEWVKELGEHDFMPDYHLHDQLLVFHSSAALHGDKLVQNRSVLIQDKASCIPAAVLDPDTDMDVIDACAAPGNKTSHLLAILSQKVAAQSSANTPTTLFAFDRDETRFRSLQQAMAPYTDPSHPIAQSVAVDTQLNDFTKVDPNDERFANVGYICLDPSCSGSGIMRQVDRVAELASSGRVDPHRLRSLKNFQAMLLSHALSFPSVKRVVYSTCSVTMEENEAVVEETLQKWADEFALAPIWIDSWMTRGKKAAYKSCLRTNPSYDLCNGFFVACFERIASAAPIGSGEARRRAPKLRGGDAAVFLKRDPQHSQQQTDAVVAKKYGKRRKTKKTGRKAKENAMKHASGAIDTGKSEMEASGADNVAAGDHGSVRKDKKKTKKSKGAKATVTESAVVSAKTDTKLAKKRDRPTDNDAGKTADKSASEEPHKKKFKKNKN